MATLEARVRALESALALPGEMEPEEGSAAAAVEIKRLRDEVDQLREALKRAEYRIRILVRSVDAKEDGGES